MLIDHFIHALNQQKYKIFEFRFVVIRRRIGNATFVPRCEN